MQHIVHKRVDLATLNSSKINSDLPFRVFRIQKVANHCSYFLYHTTNGASLEVRTRVALNVATKQQQTQQHRECTKQPHLRNQNFWITSGDIVFLTGPIIIKQPYASHVDQDKNSEYKQFVSNLLPIKIIITIIITKMKFCYLTID